MEMEECIVRMYLWMYVCDCKRQNKKNSGNCQQTLKKYIYILEDARHSSVLYICKYFVAFPQTAPGPSRNSNTQKVQDAEKVTFHLKESKATFSALKSRLFSAGKSPFQRTNRVFEFRISNSKKGIPEQWHKGEWKPAFLKSRLFPNVFEQWLKSEKGPYK
jgi:hypothetical protein